MKINGVALISRGQERVYIYGTEFRRAVYKVDGEWRFFVKIDGELIEVFHKNMYFSTEP